MPVTGAATEPGGRTTTSIDRRKRLVLGDQPWLGLGVPLQPHRLLRHQRLHHAGHQLPQPAQHAAHPEHHRLSAADGPWADLRHHLGRHRPLGGLGHGPRLGRIGQGDRGAHGCRSGRGAGHRRWLRGRAGLGRPGGPHQRPHHRQAPRALVHRHAGHGLHRARRSPHRVRRQHRGRTPGRPAQLRQRVTVLLDPRRGRRPGRAVPAGCRRRLAAKHGPRVALAGAGHGRHGRRRHVPAAQDPVRTAHLCHRWQPGGVGAGRRPCRPPDHPHLHALGHHGGHGRHPVHGALLRWLGHRRRPAPAQLHRRGHHRRREHVRRARQHHRARSSARSSSPSW